MSLFPSCWIFRAHLRPILDDFLATQVFKAVQLKKFRSCPRSADLLVRRLAPNCRFESHLEITKIPAALHDLKSWWRKRKGLPNVRVEILFCQEVRPHNPPRSRSTHHPERLSIFIQGFNPVAGSLMTRFCG